MITTSVTEALAAHRSGEEFVVYNGDCIKLLSAMSDDTVNLIVTSPPYFMGKNYDRSYDIEDFYNDHKLLAPHASRLIVPNGNVCWQVGYHVKNETIIPLDFAVYEVFRDHVELVLRNRIIWQFGHGTHAVKRFSGRHETILWYGKGRGSYFNLDAVRMPQKYPGKRHYKGPKKGLYSGNPAGKNPSDVWQIPNVKSNHVEKTRHPCQFPIALAQQLVRALSPEKGIVVDPFAGVASAGIAACLEGRTFLGAEKDASFCAVAEARYQDLRAGCLKYRPIEKEIWTPGPNDAVAQRPTHFST